jgi:type IV pilus assembly protein PilN
MAKINLLPWRAERRKARQKEFMTMLGVAAGVAALVSLLIVMYYIGQIDGQNNRNKYLTDQIALLDTQIAEIAELDKKKAGLLKRKQVIEELQSSRSQMVHLFDELARTIADGTQITSLQQNNTELSLLGRAQSNARVSTYMRNLDASGWMGNPDLSIIELRGSDPALPNEFSLKVTLKNPNDPTTASGTTPAAGTAPASSASVTAPAAAPVPASSATVASPAAATPAATPPPNITPTTPATTTPPAASAAPAASGGKP